MSEDLRPGTDGIPHAASVQWVRANAALDAVVLATKARCERLPDWQAVWAQGLAALRRDIDEHPAQNSATCCLRLPWQLLYS